MSAEDSNIIIISSCSPPPSQPPLPCRECFCFHQNHRTAPTKRQRPRSPTQSAGCAHVQKVKPESSLCSPPCAGSFITCDSGHSRTGTNCDRKTIINPLLQEDETNPDEIYLGRIKKKTNELLSLKVALLRLWNSLHCLLRNKHFHPIHLHNSCCV